MKEKYKLIPSGDETRIMDVIKGKENEQVTKENTCWHSDYTNEVQNQARLIYTVQGRAVRARGGCPVGDPGALEHGNTLLDLSGSHTGLRFIIFIVLFCMCFTFHN